jgi:hypothetical protein
VAFVCLVLLPVIISKQSFLRVIRPVYTELANSQCWVCSKRCVHPRAKLEVCLPPRLCGSRVTSNTRIWVVSK